MSSFQIGKHKNDVPFISGRFVPSYSTYYFKHLVDMAPAGETNTSFNWKSHNAHNLFSHGKIMSHTYLTHTVTNKDHLTKC